MIRIDSITVHGLSDAGPFKGSMSFVGGLQVISARNHFGKSLSVKAIAWCLAVEPMFGVRDNDPVCFPDAVRALIDFDGEKVRVHWSECITTFSRADGASISLRRAIHGDAKHVYVSETDAAGQKDTFILNARQETMRDETGGLQNFLFRWIGLPREKVAAFQGLSEIYLENLVPLFDIDQDEGWSNIQALQITRYQQQKISETAVEYLLGATEAIRSRVAFQVATQAESALRERAHSLAERIRNTMLGHGWDIAFSGLGSLRDTIARWSSRTLVYVLKREADVDLDSQKRHLLDRISKLRAVFSEAPSGNTVSTVPAEASQAAIDLKQRRHSLSVELNSLRLQFESTFSLKKSLDDKIVSASDLLRYKESGVGRLDDQVECPTCHRHLGLDTFALQQQSQESVATHIEALKRDRALIISNLSAIERATATTTASMGDVTSELRLAESALRQVNQATGRDREQLAKAALDLSAAERDLNRLEDAEGEVKRFQEELDGWISEAKGRTAPEVGTSDIKNRREVFRETLYDYLKAFGHSEVVGAQESELALDEQYTPYLGGRRLRSLGSASDQSRLVAAYTIALAVASEKVGGLHPGIVILDEPLQQNPDDAHRKLFVEFLRDGLPKEVRTQVIVFTHLRTDEASLAASRGTIVELPEGRHFLNLVIAEPTNSETNTFLELNATIETKEEAEENATSPNESIRSKAERSEPQP